MRTKKVNRYYCEHCKKSGGSAGHIKKHETSCTNNRGRVCRMCAYMGNVQTPLLDLISLLPPECEFVFRNEYGDSIDMDKMSKAIEEALPKVKEIAGGCPCCIFAALRQTYEIFPREVFDFQKEQKEKLAEYRHNDDENYGMY